MTDESVSGTPEQVGGAGAAAPSGTPAGDGADAGQVESAEQRAARLEQELEQQRKLNLSYKAKVERYNELERNGALPGAASTPPTPMPMADPDAMLLAKLEEEYQQYPTAAGYFALEMKRNQLAARQQATMFQNFIERHEPTIDAAGDDDDTKALAKEILRSGRVGDADAALWAARGQRGDKKVAAEVERARKDEVARQRVASVPGTAAGGDAAPPPGPRKMTQREFNLFLQRNEGTPAARKLIADLDNGSVVLDTSVT